MKKCKWCSPDDEGQYSMAVFTNPDGKQRITMAFSGAQITTDLSQEGIQTARMALPIYFCPMCGKRVRLKETHK